MKKRTHHRGTEEDEKRKSFIKREKKILSSLSKKPLLIFLCASVVQLLKPGFKSKRTGRSRSFTIRLS
jgi:hypothetical protein